MYSIFQPFTWEVWALHVAMMVFGAFAILFMEATGKRMEATGKHVRSLLIDADPEADDGEGGKPMRLSANGLIKSVFASLTHFLWNGPKHDPQSVSGKVALFALSFHTLIIAASYTASLAGFLATSTPVPVVVLSFDSIKTSPLASLTGRLCVLESAQASGANPETGTCCYPSHKRRAGTDTCCPSPGNRYPSHRVASSSPSPGAAKTHCTLISESRKP